MRDIRTDRLAKSRFLAWYRRSWSYPRGLTAPEEVRQVEIDRAESFRERARCFGVEEIVDETIREVRAEDDVVVWERYLRTYKT